MCSQTAEVTLSIYSAPTAQAATTAICEGSGDASLSVSTNASSPTYAWSAGTSGGNNASVTVSSPVNGTTYTVTVTDGNMCSQTAEVTLSIYSAPTAQAATTAICEGSGDANLSVSTNASSPTYAWSAGTSGGNNASVTVSSPINGTTYTVTVTDGNMCSQTAEVTLTVNPAPTPTIAGTLSFCNGREATLDAGTYPNTPNTYSWSDGATSQSISTTTAGVYTVTVTTNDMCTGTASVDVTASPCLANAGTLTTNSSSICPGDDVTASVTGEQQGANYQQQYFVYSQDNSGVTTYESSSTTGTFSGLDAGTYQVCAYNECQDCPPNPSPLTTNLDNLNSTGSIQDGCYDFSCETVVIGETFAAVEGSVSTSTTSTGLNVFTVEVCGGVQPFNADLTSSGGYASLQEYSSTNAGCLNFQVTYANGVEWTLNILDANGCGGSGLTYSSDGIETVLQPQIIDYTITPEKCPNDFDGAIELEIDHGDNSCGTYSATWTGPSYSNNPTFDASSLPATHTITGLASGTYNVTITDCEGTNIFGSYYVNRSGGESGRRRGRGGCKTASGEDLLKEVKVFPNPFNHTTTIAYSLAENSFVELAVYSIDGRLITELFKGEVLAEALQRLDFNASNLPTGMYVLELKTDSGLIYYEQISLVK